MVLQAEDMERITGEPIVCDEHGYCPNCDRNFIDEIETLQAENSRLNALLTPQSDSTADQSDST